MFRPKPGPIYARNQPRRSKNDPIVSPATLIHANSEYVHMCLQSGVETTVNLRDIAQHPETVRDFESIQDTPTDTTMNSEALTEKPASTTPSVTPPLESVNDTNTHSY